MQKYYKYLLILVILVVVVFVNFREQQQSWKKKLVNGTLSGKHQEVKPAAPAEPLKAVGSPDAKVRIKAFVEGSNGCHSSTIRVLKKIGEALPSRIRVDFVNTGTASGDKASQIANVGCKAGILINDKMKFVVKNNGETVNITFHGPLHMMPKDHLFLALKQELQKQYKRSIKPKELDNLAMLINIELAKDEGTGGPPTKAK